MYKIGKNVAKIRRNSGHAYINSSGKEINAKSVKPPCNTAKCRLKCPDKINEQQRQTIFKNFYALQDVTRQRDWIKKIYNKLNQNIDIAKKEANGLSITVTFLNAMVVKYRYVDTFF